MQQSKAIKLLKSLDSIELKRLKKFIRSPFYHQNDQLNNLYHYIRQYAPDFDSPKMDRKLVFKKLFPTEEFDMNKLRKLMTAFSQLLEEFLIVLELEQQKIQKKIVLKKALGRRNVFSLFEKHTFDLIQELEASPYRNRDYYQEMMSLHENYYFHPGSKKIDKNSNHIGKAMEQLDLYFGLAKLQLSAEMKIREKIIKEQYNIEFLDEVLEKSQQSFIHNPVFKLYSDLLLLYKTDFSKAHFERLKNCFQELNDSIAISEQQQIFYHLLNYAIRQVNAGRSGFGQQLFELYQMALDLQLVIEKGEIMPRDFSNIVATASSLGHYSWTLDFIQSYACFLKESIREDIKALSLAFLHFNQKAFDTAVILLANHHFSKETNHLQSRTLLIRCYFEQFLMEENNFEFLQDQINAFEKYLRRQKNINKNLQKAILNFANYVRRISQLKIKMEHSHFLKIKTKLLSEELITHRKWILEKMDEIEQL